MQATNRRTPPPKRAKVTPNQQADTHTQAVQPGGAGRVDEDQVLGDAAAGSHLEPQCKARKLQHSTQSNASHTAKAEATATVQAPAHSDDITQPILFVIVPQPDIEPPGVAQPHTGRQAHRAYTANHTVATLPHSRAQHKATSNTCNSSSPGSSSSSGAQ